MRSISADLKSKPNRARLTRPSDRGSRQCDGIGNGLKLSWECGYQRGSKSLSDRPATDRRTWRRCRAFCPGQDRCAHRRTRLRADCGVVHHPKRRCALTGCRSDPPLAGAPPDLAKRAPRTGRSDLRNAGVVERALAGCCAAARVRAPFCPRSALARRRRARRRLAHRPARTPPRRPALARARFMMAARGGAARIAGAVPRDRALRLAVLAAEPLSGLVLR